MGFFSDVFKGVSDLASGHLGSAWHDMTQLDANYVIPGALDVAGETVGIPPEVTGAVYGGAKGAINHGTSGILPGAEGGAKGGAYVDAATAGANIGAGAAGLTNTGLSSPLSSGADALGLTGTAAPGATGGTSLSDFVSGAANTGTSGADVSGGVGTSTLGAGGTGVGDNLTGDGAIGTGTNVTGADTAIPSTNGSISGGNGTDTLTSGGGAPSVATGDANSVTNPPTANSISQLIKNPTWDNAGIAAGNNVGGLVSGAGLGIAALNNGRQLQGQQGLAALAGQEGQNSKAMEAYLQNGTLPPGVQASINQATDAAKASIRSNYAAKGMSGSSAESQDLANADQAAQANGAKIAMQLMDTGIKESGLSSEIYNHLMQQSYTSDKDLQGALANFASNMGGGGGRGGPTININGGNVSTN